MRRCYKVGSVVVLVERRQLLAPSTAPSLPALEPTTPLVVARSPGKSVGGALLPPQLPLSSLPSTRSTQSAAGRASSHFICSLAHRWLL